MHGGVLLTLLLKTVISCFPTARSASITSRATSVEIRQTRMEGLGSVDILRPVPPAIAILTILPAVEVLIQCVKAKCPRFELHNEFMTSSIDHFPCFNTSACSTAGPRILRRSFGGD